METYETIMKANKLGLKLMNFPLIGESHQMLLFQSCSIKELEKPIVLVM